MAGTERLPLHEAPPSYWQYEANQNTTTPGYESTPIPTLCDVVIVGAGYAGIATAYHLLTSTSPPPNVVLLEAREACSGASGRNGGHLRPDYFMAAAKNVSRYNARAAAEIVQFEVSHMGVIRDLIGTESIECDFRETTSLAIFTTADQATAARAMLDTLKQAPLFRDALLSDVEFYTGDDAPQRTGVSGAKGYFATPAAQLSPYKLLTALLAKCLDLGLCLKTRTLVVSVEQPSSGSHRITTADGQALTARRVVLATNAYTGALLPEYATAIVPCKGQVCHITAPQGKLLPRLPSSSLAIMEKDAKSSTTGYEYLVQLADGSIVVGGAHHKYKEDDLGSWYDNVDDGIPIEPVQKYFEDDYMQRRFTGWADSQAGVSRAWSGIMGYTADSLPHVGEVPNREGLFVLAGFNGHGMPVIYLAAKEVAAMVGCGLAYEQTRLPSLYKTSADRLGSKRNDILAGRGLQTTAE